jgi:hypothetical protein
MPDRPELPQLWKDDAPEPADPPDTDDPGNDDDPQPVDDQPTDQLTEPDADPEGDPAPELTPEVLQRAWGDIERRDLAVSRREQDLAQMVKANKLIQQGKTVEASRLLGIDPNRVLAETWGEGFVPDEPEPAPNDDRFKSVDEKFASMEARIAAAENRRDISEALAEGAEDLPMARRMAKKSGNQFYAAVKAQADREEERTGIRVPYSQLLKQVNDYFTDDACENVATMVKEIPSMRDRFLKAINGSSAKAPPRVKGKAAKPPTKDPDDEPGDEAEPTLSGDLDTESPTEFTKPKTKEQRRMAALSHLKGNLWREKDA